MSSDVDSSDWNYENLSDFESRIHPTIKIETNIQYTINKSTCHFSPNYSIL